MALERIGLGAILEFTVGKAIGNMKAASKGLKNLERSFRQVDSGVKRAGRGVAQAAGAIRSVMLPATLALAGGAAVAVKRFAQFDDSMAVVRTIWPKSEEQLQNLGTALQDLGIQFGKKSPELAAASYQALSASIPADELQQFVELSGRTAVAGLTDMTTATDALTTVVNAYGSALGEHLTKTERAAKASDLLLKIQERGKTTLGEMGNALGFVVPLAAQMGVSMEDVGASIATLTAVGNRTSTSMTSMRQVIATLLRPTDAAKKIAKKYRLELGSQALAAKGFSGVLFDMVEKLGDNKAAFGEVFESVEAFGAIAALSADGASQFNANLAAMQNAVGATDTAFQARTNSISFQWRRTMAALGVLAERGGQAVVQGFGLRGIGGLADLIQAKMPVIVDGIRRFVEGLRAGFSAAWERTEALRMAFDRMLGPLTGITSDDMIGRIGQIVGQFVAFAGPAMLASIALKPMLGLLGGIAGIGMGAGTAIMGLVNGFKSLSMFLGAGPLGLILGGVALLVAAIATNAGGLRDTLKPLGDAFRGVMEAIGPVITMLVDSLKPILTTLVEILGTILTPIVKIIADNFRSMAPIIKVIGSILGTVAQAVGALAETLGKVLQPVLEAVGFVLQVTIQPVLWMIKWLFEKISEAGRILSGVVDDMFSRMSGGATRAERSVRNLARVMGVVEDIGARTGMIAVQEAKKQRSEAQMTALGIGATTTVQLAKGTTGVLGGLDRSIAGLRTAQAEEKKRDEESRRKRCLRLSNKMNIDGTDLTVAESRAKLEITERAGAGLTPWQRRQVVERGAISAAVVRG